MEDISLVYIFIFGLTLGSFYNVIGLRLPKSENFTTSRSQCPQCATTLTWRDLIPVFSFFVQRGKCRYCQTKISFFYPFIEILTGALFAISYMRFGLTMELAVSLVLVSLCVIVVVTDLHYMLIPNKLLLFFLPIFILLRAIEPLSPWYDSLIGFVLGGGLLAFIILISKGGMGGGDMKLLAVLGIVLGWQATLLAFFLATLIGALLSGMLLLLKVIDRKNPVPFGPYLVAGALLAYWYGASILDWYVQLLY